MARTAAQDDLNLVRDAADGRPDAFEALVARHQDRIFGVIQRMVIDREKAMDLTQETFLKAWRGLEGFQGESAFFTWLYRIARNVVMSAARHDAARPRLHLTLDEETGADGTLRRREPEDGGRRPAEQLLAGEQRELVTEAIAALQPDFREIVILRDMEDRPYEEIAELLDIPLGTVRSRLHRARMDLKERLKRVFDPAG